MTSTLELPPAPASASDLNSVIGIQGQPGSGKTTLAGMLIPEFHAAFSARKPRTEMHYANDVVWLQYDRGGADALKAYGVTPRIIDLSTPPSSKIDLFGSDDIVAINEQITAVKHAWLRHNATIFKSLVAEAKAGTVRYVAMDAMTTFVRKTTEMFRLPEVIGVKGYNGQRAYGMANMALGNLTDTLLGIPCPQVWLLHTRSTYTPDVSEVKDDQARRALPHHVEIDVQKGVQSAIEPIPSLMLGARLIADDSGKVTHQLITRPDGFFNIKNRWAAHMPPGSPPDLRQVWDVINKYYNNTNTPKG